MVLLITALYFAQSYRTESGETAAEVLHRQVDSVVQQITPRCQGTTTTTEESEDATLDYSYDEEDIEILLPQQQQRHRHSASSSSVSTQQPQQQPQTSRNSAMEQSDTASPRTVVVSPSLQVRQEWINAIFGTHYCPSGTRLQQQRQPTSGTGLAQIPAPYSSYSVRIPPVTNTEEKLGITISRLPLGLYVRKVHEHSEAAFLGVTEGSILVDLNGMCLLAEPTKQALERLWQYEGYLETGNNNGSQVDPNPLLAEREETSSNESEEGTTKTKEPVAMTFIKNGKLYKVLFLSNPPWGISWATCGNFPLVKRVYSFAARAGVQRGSIVAAVQDSSFRDGDHADLAQVLRQSFDRNQEINVTLCVPPAAARSGFFNRKMGQESEHLDNKGTPPHPRRTKRTDDGVEIRFHSLEQTIGGLCRPVSSDPKGGLDHRKSLSQFAEEVASGHVESPLLGRGSQLFTSSKTYSPCPKLGKEELLEAWDSLESLIYCLKFHSFAYREEELSKSIQSSSSLSSATGSGHVQAFQELLSGPGSPETASAFLLQIISVICAPANYRESDEEKKEENSNTSAVEAKRDAKELTSLLLKISRRDEGFCQRLYFLLRSYISSMETRRPNNPKGCEGSNSLLALLNCLELLRFAEKQLAGQIHDFNQPKDSLKSCDSIPLPPSQLSSGTAVTSVVLSTKELFPSSSPSALPASGNVSSSSMDTPSKKKGIIGFLRKKSVKGNHAKSSGVSSETTPLPLEQKTFKPLHSSSSIPNQTLNATKREPVTRTLSAEKKKMDSPSNVALARSPSIMYENMSDFLGHLDRICGTIERSLQKSFRQKIADWARQPWSASKETAVANVTTTMRQSLDEATQDTKGTLLVNPVDSSELLASVDTNECYILPSAHCPLLLTFNVSERRCSDDPVGEERIYRTTVDLIGLQGKDRLKCGAYTIHAAVAGTVTSSDSSRCVDTSGTKHSWFSGQQLIFDTRSSWGAPQTLSLRLTPSSGAPDESSASPRFGWVDLSKLWVESDATQQSQSFTAKTRLILLQSQESVFDEQGDVPEVVDSSPELVVRVKTEHVEFDNESGGSFARKRQLLYKHDDDLRQEAFAVHFIRTCDNILKANGLDMKLLTFQCIPVGTKRGFVEWVPGSVPLSEICQPFFDTLLESSSPLDAPTQSSPSMFAKAGLTKYESLTRIGSLPGESIRRLTGSNHGKPSAGMRNPVQDYLRSVAYDASSPYFVRKSVMDTYVKSAAGFCVITYVLGVGDRHLDNLLLHQSGSFFHCDFSFILGNDPKAFQPMRITEDMVQGMGGKESDNYAKFLSLASAAFLALRRPETVRVLLSLVRLMEASTLPDISENQSIDQAVMGMRDRLRLDLSSDQAVIFMEDLIDNSQSSKMWLAVDAIHSLGKKF